MKIGILTFNWAINYGAILQMYAHYKFLKDNNNDVVIINYSPKELEDLYSLKILTKPLKIKRVIRKTIESLFKRNQYNKFYEFLNNNFIMTKRIVNRDEFIETANNLDMIIVGSDQVWNYDITQQYLRDYLLTDIKCNKISYAASLGKNQIKEEVKELFKTSLKDFNYVSLREKDSITYLNDIYYREDYVSSIDPVFLLDKNQWISFANKSQYNLNEKNYILIYMLEYNENLLNKAKLLSKKYNIPIYSIEIPYLRYNRGLQGIKKLHDVGPQDFVKLFNNATYILTNSFHGTAFSLILNKKFASFAHSTVNLRMENLISLYGLNNCQVTNENKLDIEEVFLNCEKAYKDKKIKIYDEINKSKDYLLNSIEDISKRC